MGKISNNIKNNKGFTLVEVLLLIVVLILVGGLGYLGYKQVNKNSTTSTSSTTASTTKTTAVDPYAGWKTGTLKYEKISFKYPSNYTIKDESIAMPQSSDLCVYPGIDHITLTTPGGKLIKLDAGMSCFGDYSTFSFGSIPIKAFGQDMYLTFVGGGTASVINNQIPTGPSGLCLTPNSSHMGEIVSVFPFKSKNIFINGGEGTGINSFCFYPYTSENLVNGIAPDLTTTKIQNSPDYKNAVLIFESLSY
jgi:hypothetical protein